MKNAILLFILFVLLGCGRTGSERSSDLLSPLDFSEQLKTGGDIVLLDVRSPDELQTGFIDGALNLDFNSPGFESAMDNLDHSKNYLVYCASGKRSGKAKDMMKSRGFQHVSSMDGGMNAWVASGLPIQKP